MGGWSLDHRAQGTKNEFLISTSNMKKNKSTANDLGTLVVGLFCFYFLFQHTINEAIPRFEKQSTRPEGIYTEMKCRKEAQAYLAANPWEKATSPMADKIQKDCQERLHQEALEKYPNDYKWVRYKAEYHPLTGNYTYRYVH